MFPVSSVICSVQPPVTRVTYYSAFTYLVNVLVKTKKGEEEKRNLPVFWERDFQGASKTQSKKVSMNV